MGNEGAKWTKEDIDRLKILVNKGYDKKQIASELGRSITSIDLKCRRLNIEVYNSDRWWTKEDYDLLKELWFNPRYTTKGIARLMHRPVQGIIIKAQRLDLGPRNAIKENLSITDICNEMQVSRDRVSTWINKKGLVTSKNKAGKGKYNIKSEDLLEFLKNNPDSYDASKISEHLFTSEPDWLVEKRKKDAKKDHYKQYRYWTNDEDKKLEQMFKTGLSINTVAKALNRSRSSVISRKQILFIGKTYRKYYTDKEKEFLRENSPYMTVDELREQGLRNRSTESIIYMCEKLKLEYHISKERCKQR